jgi:hypothetical protein
MHPSTIPSLLAALAMGALTLSASTVEIYSVPETEIINAQFTVTVNGQPVPVIEFGHLDYPNDPIRDRRIYAHFSFEGTVEIEVNGLDGHQLLVPEDYGIVPTVQTEDRIVFTIDRPRYLVLSGGKPEGYYSRMENALFIFADPIDPRAPNPDAPNVLNYADFNGTINQALEKVGSSPWLDVLYIPPGSWYTDRHLNIPSHTTLYLAGGAKIINATVIIKHREHVSLRGRGVLELNRQMGNDYNNGVHIDYSEHIMLDGLISRNNAAWNTNAFRSNHVDIRYWKVMVNWHRTLQPD